MLLLLNFVNSFYKLPKRKHTFLFFLLFYISFYNYLFCAFWFFYTFSQFLLLQFLSLPLCVVYLSLSILPGPLILSWEKEMVQFDFVSPASNITMQLASCQYFPKNQPKLEGNKITFVLYKTLRKTCNFLFSIIFFWQIILFWLKSPISIFFYNHEVCRRYWIYHNMYSCTRIICGNMHIMDYVVQKG